MCDRPTLPIREWRPAAPYFRYGFNPVLRTQYLAAPDIAETLDVASPDALKDILSGYAPSTHAERVLAHLRKGTRYNELTGACTFDGFIRETDMAERQAARLVDLARRSYRKMSAACTAAAFPQNKRKPLVALAEHFRLFPERDYDQCPDARVPEKFEEDLAHDLLNPLLYHDKAAVILKQGSVRARSGQELRADDAFAMFENYLGIAQHKERAAIAVKNLHADRAERRAARRLQSKKMLMQAVSKIQMATLDDHVRMLKKWFVEDYGFDPANVEENSPNIVSLAVYWPLVHPDFQMLFRRHTQTRKARPDVKRFIQDWLSRATEHAERVKARDRVRKRRSRQQSRKPENGSVQIGLGKSDGVKEFNA